MKAVVAAFNQEKALVGAFSVITNLRMELVQPSTSTFTSFCLLFRKGGWLRGAAGGCCIISASRAGQVAMIRHVPRVRVSACPHQQCFVMPRTRAQRPAHTEMEIVEILNKDDIYLKLFKIIVCRWRGRGTFKRSRSEYFLPIPQSGQCGAGGA